MSDRREATGSGMSGRGAEDERPEARAAGRARGPAPAWLRTGRPALHQLMRNRRQALLALGGGALALSGLSSGAAVLFEDPNLRAIDASHGTGGGNVSPRDAGSFA